jgi:hypothetical protein
LFEINHGYNGKREFLLSRALLFRWAIEWAKDMAVLCGKMSARIPIGWSKWTRSIRYVNLKIKDACRMSISCSIAFRLVTSHRQLLWPALICNISLSFCVLMIYIYTLSTSCLAVLKLYQKDFARSTCNHIQILHLLHDQRVVSLVQFVFALPEYNCASRGAEFTLCSRLHKIPITIGQVEYIIASYYSVN